MRRACIVVGIIGAIVDLVLLMVMSAPAAVEGVGGSSWWITEIILAFVVFMLFYHAHKIKRKEKAQKEAIEFMNKPMMDDSQIMMIEHGELPIVPVAKGDTSVILEEGESMHYLAPAIKYVTKNRAIGRTGGSAGVSVRVAKGVSIRTGSGSSRTIYGEVTESYSGIMALTDKRIVFIHRHAGFEISLSALTAANAFNDSVVVQTKSKTYNFFIARQDLFLAVLSMIING